jgi:hypothetical protein
MPLIAENASCATIVSPGACGRVKYTSCVRIFCLLAALNSVSDKKGTLRSHGKIHTFHVRRLAGSVTNQNLTANANTTYTRGNENTQKYHIYYSNTTKLTPR